MSRDDIKNLPAYQVMRYLQDCTTVADYESTLQRHNIRCHLADLVPQVPGFTYRSQKWFHVVINRSLTLEQQRLTFLHELHHITVDCPRGGQLIGMDDMYTVREREADAFAQVASTLPMMADKITAE